MSRAAFIDVSGPALAPYAPLPAAAVVMLAKGKYHASPYATPEGRERWHIVNWQCPTVGLCQNWIVPVEQRTGVPVALAGRDDIRRGAPADATCSACLSAYARSSREALPHGIVSRMDGELRAARDARREAREAAAGEQLALAGEDLAGEQLADQVAEDVPPPRPRRRPAPPAPAGRPGGVQLALFAA